MATRRRRRRRRRNYAPAYCLIAVVMALSALMAALYLSKALPTGGNVSKGDEAEVAQGELPGVEAAGFKEFKPGVFYYRLSGRPYFEDGKALGGIYAENPEANLYAMRLVYLLDDTGEEVYVSPLIPPDSHLINDRLSTPLEKGIHAVTAIIQAVDEDGEVISEFEEPIALYVGEQPPGK